MNAIFRLEDPVSLRPIDCQRALIGGLRPHLARDPPDFIFERFFFKQVVGVGHPSGPPCLVGTSVLYTVAMAKIQMKRKVARKRPKKAKAGTRGLTAAESRLDDVSGEAGQALARVEESGGHVIG